MRQIYLYQISETPASEELRRCLIEEVIEPQNVWFQHTWTGKSKSNVADQDLIFHLKTTGQPKQLARPIGDGDIVMIDNRAYLLLPSRYKRLWEFNPSGVAATQ